MITIRRSGAARDGGRPGLWRLLALIGFVLLLESTFFSGLAPLLPGFQESFGVSKLGVGVLVGAYPLGILLGAVPSGMVANRIGVRRATVGGLLLMAVASGVFGLGESYEVLLAARLCQGLAAAACFACGIAWLVRQADAGQRGQVIGSALAFTILGALSGPALGALAAEVGRGPTFGVAAILAAGCALLAALETGPARAERQSVSLLMAALRQRRVLAGMWLIVLPAMLLGTLWTLGPLQLDDVGWGAGAIGATFVGAALVEAVVTPFAGRWSDRRGRLVPIGVGLILAAAVSIALPLLSVPWMLAAVIISAGFAYAFFFSPAMAQLSEMWESAGLSHEMGLVLVNVAFAPGFALGPLVITGVVAELAGNVAAYGILAGLCAVTFAALIRDRGRRGVNSAV